MLEIRLLGQFSVTLDGQPVEIATHEGRVLLAYLVLHAGKSQRRDQMARLVNEGAVDSQDLETELKSISDLLGKDKSSGFDFIRTDDSSVSFSPDSEYWLDASILDEGLQGKPQLETLMDQLAQVGGQLLPGYSEPWVILERERMRGNFEGKILYLLERLLEQGRWDEALEWGERWVAMGKAPEPAFQALMLANAGKGDLPAVVSVYQRCRRSLKEDYDQEPSHLIQETILWILQGGNPGDLARINLRLPPRKTKQVNQEIEDESVASKLKQTGRFPLGTLLNERYRLEEEIGEGGTGIVYRGFDTVLERIVAVKVLNPTLYNMEASQRIMSEALAIARLNHPNIVVIHDAGESYGAFYLILEFIAAGTLSENMPTALDDSLKMALQICSALSQVHQLGIVHRDLKPENVMFTQDGTAKLMDFGLARFDASRFTQEGNILGTVYYMAPEQALGQEIDYRADLYALGVMMYEMTSGELPFRGDDALTVITQHLYKSVKPPSQVNPEIFPDLENLILRLLNKSPEERPDSADEVSQALEVLISRVDQEEHLISGEPPPARILQGRTPPGITWYEEIEAGLHEDELQAVKSLVHRWREQGREAIDIASMAIILNSPAELTFDQEDAVLILRSALSHGVDLEPWLSRISSQEEAVAALEVILSEYPKPHIRSAIVSGLIHLGGEKSSRVLLEVASSDDSPSVRSQAAVAAAQLGKLEQVVRELQADMESSDDLAAEAAFVAVMDEVGLPKDISPYPKFSISLALSRRRIRSQWGKIFRQAGRAAAGGGLILALNGLFAPFYVALSFPDMYQEQLKTYTLQFWMISGALGSMLLGAPQGFASGFIIGIVDAIWRERSRRILRFILGSLAGMVLAGTILLINPADPSELLISFASYNALYILYGLTMGAIITLTIPILVENASWKIQLRRAILAAALAAAATLLLLFLIYRGEFYLYIPARFFIAVLLPIGIAIALVRQNK